MVLHDTDIRERLFYKLEMSGEKLRIFEEVIIGKSRCDLFVVKEDRLIGGEIKSDADSYARLKGQVRCYDRVFNENYLIVGRSHLKSAADHVPAHWGLICADDAGVELVREAGENPKVKLEAQLRLLWKRELRHILQRYNLPKYQRCSRAYITKKLMDCIDEGMLRREICEELFERDYVAEGFFEPDDVEW